MQCLAEAFGDPCGATLLCLVQGMRFQHQGSILHVLVTWKFPKDVDRVILSCPVRLAGTWQGRICTLGARPSVPRTPRPGGMPGCIPACSKPTWQCTPHSRAMQGCIPAGSLWPRWLHSKPRKALRTKLVRALQQCSHNSSLLAASCTHCWHIRGQAGFLGPDIARWSAGPLEALSERLNRLQVSHWPS